MSLTFDKNLARQKILFWIKNHLSCEELHLIKLKGRAAEVNEVEANFFSINFLKVEFIFKRKLTVH
jgi:hypothetical protein